MSNSHWDHFFFHDDFGVIRSKINFFSGGKVCLVVASGGHVPLLPPLGSGTGQIDRQNKISWLMCMWHNHIYISGVLPTT